jgi:hypothetical protein
MINKSKKSGYILIQVVVYAFIAVIIIGGIVGWTNTNIRASRTVIAREQAFQIAEAGLEYYRWHLAHADQDFYDGLTSSTSPGPYTHNYYDKDGNLIGKFTLTITPPSVGSTLVKVQSKGTVVSDPNVSRTLEAKLAKPSWAKYSVAANDEMRFGLGTEVFGPIHSNQGIRFDGLAHNIVTSAVPNYNDPDHGGHAGYKEFGVHTHRNHPPDTGINNNFRDLESTYNSSVPTRNDVFLAGRQFPVPALDFNGFDSSLTSLKNKANTGGKYFSASGKEGYHVVLKTNGTYDVYKVNSQTSKPPGCSGQQGDQGWDTWSIASGGESFIANYPIPANGVIFFEDDVWVDGQINNARVLIVAAKIGERNANKIAQITVNRDLKYTNYDGRDVIGLIAQGNINAGLQSEDDLRIDAALIAVHGRVGRYYYNRYCGTYYLRSTITLYGMIGTNNRYGFAYVDGVGNRSSGYNTRNIIYDANLLYSPPPSFPLTADQYQIVSWREVK